MLCKDVLGWGTPELVQIRLNRSPKERVSIPLTAGCSVCRVDSCLSQDLSTCYLFPSFLPSSLPEASSLTQPLPVLVLDPNSCC